MLRFSLPLLFLIFNPHLILSSFSLHCRPDESSALIQLNTRIGWNESTDCCTWEGITCDETTGFVIGLFLFVDELSSTTIASNSTLFWLRNLQSLDFSSTSLKLGASAFESLTLNLTNLKKLDMSFSDLSSVPPANLRNLSSSLTSLTLDSSMLRGELPGDFFEKFPKLEELNLAGNFLGGKIPGSCFNLRNLTYLSLSDNDFEGQIPESAGRVSLALKRLSLSRNRLRGVVPRSIFRNEGIEIFDLSSNNLSGIVELDELSRLRKLIYLDFSSNNLSLSFNNSEKYPKFEKLWYLSLSSCNIAEFPSFLKSAKQVQFLDLSNNHLHGSVPKWISKGNHLFVSLNLSQNSLTHIGSISGEVLQFIDLRSNSFSGPLPTPSAQFLRFFSASRNNFSGEISSSICNLTVLEVLDLSYNSLSGEIPKCIGNFSRTLSVMDLRGNRLKGPILATFATGNSLRNINLNGNQLEGALPRSLANCGFLEVLDLGNNELNDTFPDWLESLPSLQVIVLRANKFRGSIGNPSHESPFLGLRIMDLSHNDFTGDLPTNYFKNFKAIQASRERTQMGYMGQDYYQDSVTVTMKGSDFKLVKIQTIFSLLDFSSNNFSGEIPELIGKLESLKGLNLSHNMLRGQMPSSLGNLTNLEGLDLSSNELVGEIPIELANIPWLAILNLSNNNLVGPIPRGNQFNTFVNESFSGNSGLCGFPLSRQCGTGDTEPSAAFVDHDDDSSIEISWRIVMMGYASGLAIGVSIGYVFLYSNGRILKRSMRKNVQRR